MVKNKIKVKIKPRSLLARLAARKLKVERVAIVFGRTIHLHNVSVEQFIADKHWLLHELKHVDQYEKLGLTAFILTYLKESFQKGYHLNKLEIEAREAEKDLYLLEKYEMMW